MLRLAPADVRAHRATTAATSVPTAIAQPLPDVFDDSAAGKEKGGGDKKRAPSPTATKSSSTAVAGTSTTTTTTVATVPTPSPAKPKPHTVTPGPIVHLYKENDGMTYVNKMNNMLCVLCLSCIILRCERNY